MVFNRGFAGGGISSNLNGTVSLRFTLVAFNSRPPGVALARLLAQAPGPGWRPAGAGQPPLG